MKKIFFLIIFLNSFITQAQFYQPFPDSNAIWSESGGRFECCPNTTFNEAYFYFLEKDSTVNGKQYKIVLKTGNLRQTGWNDSYSTYSNGYSGLLRQDSINKKVYYILRSDTIENLLYDFNLKEGDTLPKTIINNGNNYVKKIDSVLIDTVYHKRYAIAYGDTSFVSYVYLIEGIGNSFGLFGYLLPPFESSTSLQCFMKNNKKVYPDTSGRCDLTVSIKEVNKKKFAFSVYPNPAETYLTIEVNKEQEETISYSIKDILGRTHAYGKIIKGLTKVDISNLSTGIYFCEIVSEERKLIKKLFVKNSF